MRKALKIGAILAGIVVALLVILVIVATILVDPNRYRDQIIQTVKTQTGRDLKIEGNLKLSFFPWIGLETGRLELSNAPGFGPDPFARVDTAAVKVELLPLLRKSVIVDAVRLQGLRLNLARAKDGRTNWEDMLKAKAEPKPAPQPQPQQPDASAGLALFTVNRVEVRNAEFTWRDQMAGANYALRRVELTSGNILGGQPAALHLAFDLESGKPKIARRIELDAKLNADLAAEKLNVSDLRLSAGDLRLQAKLEGTDIIRAPKLQGRVELPPFNLRALLQELQIPYAPVDAAVLKKVGLIAQVGYTPQAIAVSDLRVTLDNSALTGKLTAQRQPRASYKFDLALDNIDVDRYLPPSQKDAKDDSKADKGNAQAAVVPIALLRDTDADGQIRVQKIKAFGVHAEQVALKVAAHGGRIVLGPNEARLYGGVYAGKSTVDASTATPRLQLDEKLTDVQLGPFLKDAQIFDKFSGAGNVTLALTGQGLNADAIKRTLNGSVAVAIRDGAIEGFDLAKIEAKVKELRDQPGGTAKNLVGSLSTLTPEKGDKTTFTKLQASAAVTNGVANNKDLAIEGPRLRVTGSGKINLVANRFENYVLQVNGLPLILDGPFGTLPKPDWNAILKGQTEQKIEQKKEEVRDILRDRLRERLKR